MRTTISLLMLIAAWVADVRADTNADLINFENTVRSYNLLSLGSVSLNNYNTIDGGIAVFGSLTMTGGSIASQYSAGTDASLYVAGSVAINGYVNLGNGYASLPGVTSYSWDSVQRRLTTGGGTLSTVNSSDALAKVNPVRNAAPTWTNLSTTLQTISANLAAATVSGTISVSNNALVFTSSVQSGVAVFTLDASSLSNNSYYGSSFSNLVINVPTDVTYVINVVNASGKTLFGSGVNFNQGTNNDRLLWNIVGSGNVSLGGGHFYGSVLAPGMSVSNANNTYIDGQLAVGSFTLNNAGLQYAHFAHPVPEPAWTGLIVMTSALGGFFGWSWFARRKSANGKKA